MALGARGRPIPPIHEVRRGVQAAGGYVEEPGGAIRGLVYAGAVAWLAGLGLQGETRLGLSAAGLPSLLGDGSLFIASVHPGIRRPGVPPSSRGGHLVLVFGTAEDGALRFHNPSGDTPATQADARLAPEAFGLFFAGRGILIR